MWLFKERQRKIFCKEPPRVNQILHQVYSLICTPKKEQPSSITFKSHNGQALDHRRLIRPGKKIRPNFLRSTSLLYKILPTNLGEWKPTFLPFVHHIWGETVLWGTVFIIQTSDRYSLKRFLFICGNKMSKDFLKFCKLISNLMLGQIVSNLTNVHKLISRINYARLH